MFGRFAALGDNRAMMKREMNIRNLPKQLQYAAVSVLLVLALVTLLNWFVRLIFGVPLLEMLLGPGVNEAYRTISHSSFIA